MAAFNLPNLRGDINAARDLKELKNYLFQLVETLEYTLNNLDTENLSDAYNASNNYVSVGEAAAQAKQAAAEAQAIAVQIGRAAVPAQRIIAAINESTEVVQIKGNKIIMAAADGDITLLGRDSNGNIVPCKAVVTGNAESGFSLVISASE